MGIIIEHDRQETGGEFFIASGAERIGKLVYTRFGAGRLIIQHTEVSSELQGTGASVQLVDAAADFARSLGVRIIPVCPFAKKYMSIKREKYADVLA